MIENEGATEMNMRNKGDETQLQWTTKAWTRQQKRQTTSILRNDNTTSQDHIVASWDKHQISDPNHPPRQSIRSMYFVVDNRNDVLFKFWQLFFAIGCDGRRRCFSNGGGKAGMCLRVISIFWIFLMELDWWTDKENYDTSFARLRNSSSFLAQLSYTYTDTFSRGSVGIS